MKKVYLIREVYENGTNIDTIKKMSRFAAKEACVDLLKNHTYLNSPIVKVELYKVTKILTGTFYITSCRGLMIDPTKAKMYVPIATYSFRPVKK